MNTMKKMVSLGFFFLWGAFLATGCAPSPGQIQKTLEENPEIISNLIEKNPEKFAPAFQRVAAEGQKLARQTTQQQEQERIQNQLKNPLKPDLSQTRPAKGKKSAPINIVEYSDFQCPYCARAYGTVNQVMDKYPDKVYFVYKHLPLPFHPLAMPASQRYEAISLQSPEKALLFHDKVFDQQKSLGSGGEEFLDGIAEEIGVDVPRMKKDMESPEVKARIQADMAEARKFGISGTPGFVVNGVSIRGARPVASFQEVIEATVGKNP